MSVFLKLLPETYSEIRKFGKSVLKTVGSEVPINPKTLRYRTPQQLSEEIRQAYSIYSRSPYINTYLREGKLLKEADEQLVWALKAAIHTSKPVTGTYVRGLMPKRGMPINPETIEQFIFNNKGFTSTVPVENASFASCFSSSGGATVKFEITKPMQAYRASNYEVLFDTNAFTKDKFKIIHEGNNTYRVVQR